MNLLSLKGSLPDIKKVFYFPEIESTNLYAKSSNLDEDSLVITDYQISGKGRFGRVWKSIPGLNLCFTLVKKLPLNLDELQLLNLYTAYSLVCVLKNLFPKLEKKLILKWPNDILLSNKKICGILIEVQNLKNKNKKFLIGIGLNVNQTDFPNDISENASSLKKESKQSSDISRESILINFIKFFYENLSLLKDRQALINSWMASSAIVDKKITYKQHEDGLEQTGIAKGLDNDCGLIIEFPDKKRKTFYSGEISLLYK
ncbi:MAG TPA: biotin--[acetyl-CoA-carboxylase] ligase [Ignavibacteria bacterium]|nr:biotin--[acetyl-CoA-carboxylase] ligase [Ignavibacteria bacterium]